MQYNIFLLQVEISSAIVEVFPKIRRFQIEGRSRGNQRDRFVEALASSLRTRQLLSRFFPQRFSKKTGPGDLWEVGWPVRSCREPLPFLEHSLRFFFVDSSQGISLSSGIPRNFLSRYQRNETKNETKQRRKRRRERQREREREQIPRNGLSDRFEFSIPREMLLPLSKTVSFAHFSSPLFFSFCFLSLSLSLSFVRSFVPSRATGGRRGSRHRCKKQKRYRAKERRFFRLR